MILWQEMNGETEFYRAGDVAQLAEYLLSMQERSSGFDQQIPINQV